MAFIVADRVKETTTTTGTGTVTLLGTSAGFQSFAAIGNTNTTYYAIVALTGTEWETGIGTYSTTGPTLARTTVIASSNSGSAVNFSAGTKEVFVTPPASTYAPVTGQAFYGVGAGAYSWTVPINVTSVCVVCIGAGSGGYSNWSSGGGGAGGLAYKNNIVVVPGAVWTVTVGVGGDTGAGRGNGGLSSFTSPTSVVACRADGGNFSSGGSGGIALGYDGGGNGGNGGTYGGGGAGGYTGTGGSPGSGGSGGGGAGGGQYSSTYGNSGGGGVGPFGQGSSGTNSNYAAGGGSGGETSTGRENPYQTNQYGSYVSPGGRYGGGGGAPGTTTLGLGSNRGADGCVRIIWGSGRSFPSTGTGDM